MHGTLQSKGKDKNRFRSIRNNCWKGAFDVAKNASFEIFEVETAVPYYELETRVSGYDNVNETRIWLKQRETGEGTFHYY